jgi:hypothetical protein
MDSPPGLGAPNFDAKIQLVGDDPTLVTDGMSSDQIVRDVAQTSVI